MKHKEEEEKQLEIKLPNNEEKIFQNPYLDEKDERLLNFIAKHWTKNPKRRRIHLKIKSIKK